MFLKAVLLSDIVEAVLVDDIGLLRLHLGRHTRHDPPLDGDIRALLVNVFG